MLFVVLFVFMWLYHLLQDHTGFELMDFHFQIKNQLSDAHLVHQRLDSASRKANVKVEWCVVSSFRGSWRLNHTVTINHTAITLTAECNRKPLIQAMTLSISNIVLANTDTCLAWRAFWTLRTSDSCRILFVVESITKKFISIILQICRMVGWLV